jgi:undecaprenyl diphosphate synthase
MTVPTHLGVIPDGNRRWARDRGLPTVAGHRRGLTMAKRVALAAFDRGVRYFTMYAFSTENWSRLQGEVGYLMELFYGLLKREFKEFEKRGVRFRFLGSYERLPAKLVKILRDTEERTKNFTRGTLSFCLNYGGQTELVHTFRAMLAAGVDPQDVTPELVSAYMQAPDIPPVDLVIRTSGEQRMSGFMMWRTAYAEYYFVKKHWPDFSVAELDLALADFSGRQRRFGGSKVQ